MVISVEILTVVMGAIVFLQLIGLISYFLNGRTDKAAIPFAATNVVAVSLILGLLLSIDAGMLEVITNFNH